MREELLVHIAKEATAVREVGWRALKVVSDIDDTFLCSGGSFPSGTLTVEPFLRKPVSEAGTHLHNV